MPIVHIYIFWQTALTHHTHVCVCVFKFNSFYYIIYTIYSQHSSYHIALMRNPNRMTRVKIDNTRTRRQNQAIFAS